MKAASLQTAVTAVAALSLTPLDTRAQAPNKDTQPTVTSIERLETSAKFMAKDGQAKVASVTLRQVSVYGKDPLDPISGPGFRLMTLRAGKVTTSLDDREQKRNPGDIWTVPESAKFSLRVQGEAAVIDIITVIVH